MTQDQRERAVYELGKQLGQAKVTPEEMASLAIMLVGSWSLYGEGSGEGEMRSCLLTLREKAEESFRAI